MAQYKIIQDIEAEDKLLGPLTLRQFIYAVIVVVLGFVAWRMLLIQPFLVIPFLPPIIFFALLAAPLGREQSSEVWLLGKIKYFIFPRKRIWNPDGIQDLVTITAPKVEEKAVIKEFDKDEARSRLKALASTMDTRGWAIKNLSTPGYAGPMGQASSERLLELQTDLPIDSVNVKPTEDVLSTGNPLMQTLGNMVDQNNQEHRQAILQKMQTIAAEQHTQAQQRLSQAPAVQPTPPVVTPTVTPPVPKIAQEPAMTQPAAPVILDGVKSPSAPQELHVNNATPKPDADDGEVVISLH